MGTQTESPGPASPDLESQRPMPSLTYRLSVLIALLLFYAGGLAVFPFLPDPGAPKLLLMIPAMAALCALHWKNLVPSPRLIPLFAYWIYAYLDLTPLNSGPEAGMLLLGGILAFFTGYLRVPLAHRILVPLVALLCIARGVADLITLSPLGAPAILPEAAATGAGLHAATSFFLDQHVFGILLVLAAFHHFHRMEARAQSRHVQVLLYSSALLVVLSIALVGSSGVHATFFLCFLALLFVSVRLDFREPTLERLIWVTGMTLSFGLAWIHLPDRQMLDMTRLFSFSQNPLLWSWSSAWQAFLAAPMFGSGTGSFVFAVIPHETAWLSAPGEGVLPALLHGRNHFLEVLVENGTVGLGLEALMLGTALFALARTYFRDGDLKSRYLFFALAALAVQGSFSDVLEHAPARIAYWILIGCGWSRMAMEPLPLRGYLMRGWMAGIGRVLPDLASRFRLSLRAVLGGRTFRMGLAIVLGSLTVYQSGAALARLRADYLCGQALEAGQARPQAYTDNLAEALRMQPRHEAANYNYARVLAGFRRYEEALMRVAYVQTFAPDRKKNWEALAGIHFDAGRFDSSAHYAGLIQSRYPFHLPSLDILMESLLKLGRCAAFDSVQGTAPALLSHYPPPDPRDHTIRSLDSLFTANRDINFLQRWFGGKALRQRFVDRRRAAYNLDAETHAGLRSLMETRCPIGEEPSLPVPEGDRPRKAKRLFRGFVKIRFQPEILAVAGMGHKAILSP